MREIILSNRKKVMLNLREDQLVELFVPSDHFREVNGYLKSSGVKFYPFSKTYGGYVMRFKPHDHPLVSYLALKYDVSIND